MTKVKLKLPSLKSTSKDIAEDLKAIREALNTTRENAERKYTSSGRQSSKNPPQRRIDAIRSTVESNEKLPTSPSCSLDDQTTNGSPANRPIRQRKPNQRYTDLESEKEDRQTASRKRTLSAVSTASSNEELAPESKVGRSPSGKKNAKSSVSSNDKKKSTKAKKLEQIVEPELVASNKSSPVKKKRGSPGKRRSGGLGSDSFAPLHSRAKGGFEAPPEFDDEEDESNAASPHAIANIARESYDAAMNLLDSQRFVHGDVNDSYHALLNGSPATMQNVNASVTVAASSPYSSLQDFADAIHQYKEHSESVTTTYEERGNASSEYSDEGPMLVFGAGPRTLTYNGEYYPLDPVVFKRRPGKFPRPRSARYKPFSPDYKPPDVSRYRERFKKLQQASRRGRGRRSASSLMSTSAYFRRAASNFYPPTLLSGGVGDQLWSYEQFLQADESKDAVDGLRSSAYGDIGGGGGHYASDGGYAKASPFDEYYDTDAYLSGGELSMSRRRGGRRRHGGIVSAAMAEEAAARGVYAEIGRGAEDDASLTRSLMESYRFGYGKSLLAPTDGLTLSSPSAGGDFDPSKFSFIPPEIAGDHCYIKPKGGASLVTVDVERPAADDDDDDDAAVDDPSIAGITVDENDNSGDGNVRGDGSSAVVVLDDGTIIEESFGYAGTVGGGQSASAYCTVGDQSASLASRESAMIGRSRMAAANRRFPSQSVMLQRQMVDAGVYDEEDDDDDDAGDEDDVIDDDGVDEGDDEYDGPSSYMFKQANRR